MHRRLGVWLLPVAGLLVACGDPVGAYFPADEPADSAAPDANDANDARDAAVDARDAAVDARDAAVDARDAGVDASDAANDAADASGECLRVTELWVDAPDKVASLAGVTCVEGFVRVTGAAEAGGVVALPDLERIEGSVEISGASTVTFTAPRLARVRDGIDLLTRGVVQLPALASAGSLVVEGAAVASLPALVRADAVTIRDETGAVLVPRLAAVDHDFEVNGATALTSFGAGALETVGGALRIEGDGALASASFPTLRSAGAVWVGHDAALTALDFTALADVAGAASFTTVDRLVELALPSLETTGPLAIEGDRGAPASGMGALTNVRLPKLRSAARVEIAGTHATEIALPSLVATAGSLNVSGHPSLRRLIAPMLKTVGGDLGITDMAMLTSLDFPSLTYAKILAVNNVAALTDLSGLPALAEVAALDVSLAGKLGVRGLTALTTAQIVRLDQVGGAVLLDLPKLEKITTRLSITGSVEATFIGRLPSLTVVGAIDIHDNVKLVSLDGLDALVRVTDGIAIAKNDALTDVDALARITTVGGALVSITGPALATVRLSALTKLQGLKVIGAPQLVRIDLGALTRVVDVEIADDPALVAVATPALTAVDDRLELKNDASLSACVPIALRAQVSTPERVIASGLKDDPACP